MAKVIARKGDVGLNLRLETAYQMHLCSLPINLKGELGEHATPDPKNRELSISDIAESLDRNYESPAAGIRSVEELPNILMLYKTELLTYCKDILLGDVTSWRTVFDVLSSK